MCSMGDQTEPDCFWNEVEARSLRHSLHSHRYFDYLLGQQGDIREVKIFSEQFYLFCVTFHRCLGGLISTTPNQRIIAMLADNLYDEMGSGDLSKSHLEILKRFSRSIGYSDEDIDSIQPLAVTQELNAWMIATSKEDFFVGVGAVALGAEFAGAEFFRQVYVAFQKKACLLSADTEIYAIHAQDDSRHRADIRAALSMMSFSKLERSRMMYGINLSDALFFNFWEGVGEASGFYKASRRPLPSFHIH